MAAEGLIIFDELRAKLLDLEDACKVAERELEMARKHRQHIASMEQNKEFLLENFQRVQPEALASATPEYRRQAYQSYRLKVVARPGGGVWISGLFDPGSTACNSEPISRGRPEPR